MTHYQVNCRGDGAEGEDETASFSPVKERYIRRQIFFVAAGTAFTCAALVWTVVAVLTRSYYGYVTGPWAILSLIWVCDCAARIATTFADERDKARADRRTLNQLVSARGRGAAGSADGRERGYSLPSATVVPINGKRVR